MTKFVLIGPLHLLVCGPPLRIFMWILLGVNGPRLKTSDLNKLNSSQIMLCSYQSGLQIQGHVLHTCALS